MMMIALVAIGDGSGEVLADSRQHPQIALRRPERRARHSRLTSRHGRLYSEGPGVARRCGER
jgi:hypothetical protein